MSFSSLPTEIKCKIVSYVLSAATADASPSTVITAGPLAKNPSDSHPERFLLPAVTTPSGRALAALKTASTIASVGIPMSTAVNVCMSRNFHAFEPIRLPTVDAVDARWIPRRSSRSGEVRKYYAFYLDECAPATNDLHFQANAFDRHNAYAARSVKVDARVPGVASNHNHTVSSLWFFHYWVASAMLVCRIGIPNPNLKFLHLRLSAHPELFDRVQHIVQTNPQLVDIVIEADFPWDHEHFPRASVQLDDLCPADSQNFPLERFILRAPGVQVRTSNKASFHHRIQNCSIFALAVSSLDHHCPAWSWAHSILRTLQHAQRIEISIADSTDDHTLSPAELEGLTMPDLEHLILDFQGIDAPFLDSIATPKLQCLRLRTDSILLSDDHHRPGRFDCITYACIVCPGSLLDRFKVLGLLPHHIIACVERTTPNTYDSDEEATYIARKCVSNHHLHEQDNGVSSPDRIEEDSMPSAKRRYIPSLNV